MATTYFIVDLRAESTGFTRDLAQNAIDEFRKSREELRIGLHHLADFISKWICCDGVDDESVIENVRSLTAVHDNLAEEYVEFTHLSKQHHRTLLPVAIDILENELPLTSQQNPAQDNVVGHHVELMQEPALVVEVVIPQDVEPADAIVVFEPAAMAVAHANHPVEDEGVAVHPVVAEEETDRPVVDEELDTPATQVFTICHDVIEVKNSRRVATKGRKFYESAVVCEIKNKLGLPKVTEANKLVVRRMAHNIMMKHGLRPTHIRQSIEKVVAGVFVPDQFDVGGAQILASNAVADLREQVTSAGPRNGWSAVCDLFRFGLARRGASRVPPVTGPP